MATQKFEDVARELNLSKFLDEYNLHDIEDGIRAVDAVEGGWEFLRGYEVHPMKGFMFADPNPTLEEIGSKLHNGHSGASYGGTMRTLHFIAKYGVREYRLTAGWSASWDIPPSGAHFLYSDGRAAEHYRNILSYMSAEDLEKYEILLPEKLLKFYPDDAQQERRDELMREFQTAKSTL
jgi:hypothetical protein